jgi:PAS domain S-box-containing protein
MSSPADALNEKEDFYNNAPCGFHSLDKDGAFVRVNDTELRWLGYERNELIGKKISDLLAPESVKPLNDAFPDFILHGCLRDLEVRLVRKDGSILPVLMSANAVRDSQGNYVMSRSILYDITGLKRTEQKFRELLEAAPDAMVAVDADGRIGLINTQAREMFGYGHEELLGRQIKALMPGFFRHTDHMGVGFELRGERKDGSKFPVEISLSPLETGEGHLVLCAIRDITGRKRMDEALRAGEERFRVALKNSPVVVFNQDHELRYTWINAPVLGWAAEAYVGHTDAEIVGGEQGGRLMAIKQGVLRSGIGTRTETAVTFQGETHYYDLTVEPLRDDLGVIVGVTCSATDITPLKQAVVELERLNQLKTEFLGMAAHDLRNPIGSVLAVTNFLCDDVATVLTAEQLGLLFGIRRSSEFMLQLIDDFLDLSSIESGKLSLNRQPSDLRKLLKHNIGLNAKLAWQKHIHVSLHIEGALPELPLDEGKIEQVLNNLISNAVKFSQPGTTVEVRAAAQDGEVLISVRDWGPGISEAERVKLFQPFGRTSVHSTAGERSTGLGLAISRKIVEGHGGHIWVESQASMGSVFLLTLPAA